ncbi:hypothetical protein MP638_004674 [Amoeboaphelidium occidentale]|nr:hypothetical protein MP638_004674 [Amoeboaphelidium occidentale]
MIINTWPALYLVMQNDGDGMQRAEMKRENLMEAVWDLYAEQKGNVDEDDLIILFDAFFEDVFDIVVEDGSIEEYSSLLAKMAKDVIENGTESSLYKKILQEYESKIGRMNNLQNSLSVVEESIEVAEDGADESPAATQCPANSNSVNDMDIDQQMHQPEDSKEEEMEADEDGWIKVNTKRKGKKK